MPVCSFYQGRRNLLDIDSSHYKDFVISFLLSVGFGYNIDVLKILEWDVVQHRCTENFGRGRLPSSAFLTVGTGGGAGGVNNTLCSV